MTNDTERTEVIRKVRASADADPAKAKQLEEYLKAAEPLIRELAGLGYSVETVDDLRHLGRPWKSALPVLIKWLPRIDHIGVKEGIVRGLSVPWVGNHATALLIDEFKTSDAGRSLAWAIGNALSIVSVEGFEGEIIKLSNNPKYGVARQMIVLSLGRMGSSEAEEAALSLLKDEDVKLHAIVALGDMKSQRALPELEKLLKDKRPAIRKETRKAVAKITGG
jgi:HEAT repeat protein